MQLSASRCLVADPPIAVRVVDVPARQHGGGRQPFRGLVATNSRERIARRALAGGSHRACIDDGIHPRTALIYFCLGQDSWAAEDLMPRTVQQQGHRRSRRTRKAIRHLEINLKVMEPLDELGQVHDFRLPGEAARMRSPTVKSSRRCRCTGHLRTSTQREECGPRQHRQPSSATATLDPGTPLNTDATRLTPQLALPPSPLHGLGLPPVRAVHVFAPPRSEFTCSTQRSRSACVRFPARSTRSSRTSS